jgi:single-stranded-DNA-specific exonuclease
MTEATVRELNRLEPFGVGNRAPLFCIADVTVAGPPRVVGKDGKHLQLTVRQGTSSIKCIAFGHADATSWLKSGSRIDIAGEPTVSEYLGRRSVEFKVKDLRVADSMGDEPLSRKGAVRVPVGE